MIAEVTAWGRHVAAQLTPEATERLVGRTVLACLRAGTLATMQLVAAAEHYREIDLALRRLFIEGLDVPGADLSALTTTMKAYLQRMAARDITPESQGGETTVSTINRDMALVVLMSLALTCWPHLRKTRASQIVAAGAQASGVADIKAKQVLHIYTHHDQIWSRLTQLIPG
jgi:hypothetical protein